MGIIIKGRTVFGPNIVTDGLVLYLDAANPKSYPGTGNTWYDISGFNNHGTMNNFIGSGPDISSGYDSNTKYMMFDRHLGIGDGVSNNRVNFSSSSSLLDCYSENGVSIELWLKIKTPVCTAITKMHGVWEIYYCSTLTHRTERTTGTTELSSSLYNTTYTTFHNIIATHDGTNRKIFVNGIKIAEDVNICTGQIFNALSLGGYSNGNYAFIGAMSIYRLYNRALADNEVLQNYNAFKSRF